jgi:hypothetical protein
MSKDREDIRWEAVTAHDVYRALEAIEIVIAAAVEVAHEEAREHECFLCPDAVAEVEAAARTALMHAINEESCDPTSDEAWDRTTEAATAAAIETMTDNSQA